MYGESRRERALSVWHGSLKAGEVYDGWGPHKLDFEGIQEDLIAIFPPVWDYDIDKEVEADVERLRELGIYN